MKLFKLWDEFWFQPTSPSPVCAFRIIYGLLVLATAALLAPDLLNWFGPHGITSISAAKLWEGGPRFSLLFLLPNTNSSVIALFSLLIIAALCLTLGFRTRLSAAVLFVCLVSFDHRNPIILNSGDTLLRLFALLLAFSPAGYDFSIDRWLAQRRAKAPLAVPDAAPWVQRLMQLQLAAVYFQAFWSKIAGDTWSDGTALYYTSRLLDFQRLPIPFVFDNLWTIKLLTWSSLGIECALWTLIWWKPFRYYVLVAGVLLHLGIDWSMNLPIFEYLMIASYLLFIDPKDINACARAVYSGFSRVQSSPQQVKLNDNMSEPEKVRRLIKVPFVPALQVSAGTSLIVGGLLVLVMLIQGGMVWSEFPLNGNPFTWQKARDSYLNGIKARAGHDYEDARTHFKQSVATYDNDPKFLIALGDCEFHLKHYPQAETAYRQAVKIAPRNATASNGLSRALAAQDKVDEAEKEMLRTLEFAPRDPVATAQLGLLKASQGKLKDAERLFDQTKKYDRDVAQYWCLLGRYFRLIDKPEEAEASFRQAISKDPMDPEYYVWLGLHLYSKHELDEAEQNLGRGLNLNPADSDAWEALGFAQIMQKRFDTGIASLKQADSLSPNKHDYNAPIGLALHASGKWSEAEPVLALAAHKTPDDVDLQIKYMDALLHQKKLEQIETEMAQWLSTSHNIEPNDIAGGWIYLGNAFAYDGKTELAKRAYQKAIDSTNNANLRQEAADKLKSPPAPLPQEKQGTDNGSTKIPPGAGNTDSNGEAQE
jgi:tetratricopeptide (TPR) repeat protein